MSGRFRLKNGRFIKKSALDKREKGLAALKRAREEKKTGVKSTESDVNVAQGNRGGRTRLAASVRYRRERQTGGQRDTANQTLRKIRRETRNVAFNPSRAAYNCNVAVDYILNDKMCEKSRNVQVLDATNIKHELEDRTQIDAMAQDRLNAQEVPENVAFTGNPSNSDEREFLPDIVAANLVSVKQEPEEEITCDIDENYHPTYHESTDSNIDCEENAARLGALNQNEGEFESDQWYVSHESEAQTTDSSQRVNTRVERRRERQQRYRERNREVIRERNRHYYSQKRQNAEITVNDSEFDDIEAITNVEPSINKEAVKKQLRRERDRRYRQEHRETLKQRNKDYRQRKRNVQKGSGAFDGQPQEREENKAAERSCLYRERHREEIIQPRRENKQRQNGSHPKRTKSKAEGEMETSENSSLCPGMSNLSKARRYYMRHKDEINQKKRDKRLEMKTLRPTPISGAERSRKYRLQHKEKLKVKRREYRLRKRKAKEGWYSSDLEDSLEDSEYDEETVSSSDEDMQEMEHDVTGREKLKTQDFEGKGVFITKQNLLVQTQDENSSKIDRSVSVKVENDADSLNDKDKQGEQSLAHGKSIENGPTETQKTTSGTITFNDENSSRLDQSISVKVEIDAGNMNDKDQQEEQSCTNHKAIENEPSEKEKTPSDTNACNDGNNFERTNGLVTIKEEPRDDMCDVIDNSPSADHEPTLASNYDRGKKDGNNFERTNGLVTIKEEPRDDSCDLIDNGPSADCKPTPTSNYDCDTLTNAEGNVYIKEEVDCAIIKAEQDETILNGNASGKNPDLTPAHRAGTPNIENNDYIKLEVPIHISEEPMENMENVESFLQCNTCRAYFRTDETLKSHICKANSTDQELWTCDTCNGQISYEFRFIHMDFHKTNLDKEYKCKWCHKVFRKKRQLTKHTKIHTEIWRYKCKKCEKSFHKKKNLVEHKKIHLDRKEFPCDLCDQSFIKKRDLTYHLKVHAGIKDVKCPVCDRAFVRESTMEVHKRLHSVERDYKCPSCDKSFYRKHDLTIHLKIHAGVKDYLCDSCPQSFVRQFALKRHMLTHSKNKAKKLCKTSEPKKDKQS